MRPREVLVIDGEPAVRDALRDLLEDDGYLVRTVADTASGLRILRVTPNPMAVLFDVVPLAALTRSESGLGLLDAVDNDKQRLSRHAYIMMSTAPEQAVARADTPPHLNIGLLPEPFDVEDLLRTVEAASLSASTAASRAR
jgi:DNA-binding NtrC family response regulator